jgi:hypothetical protein
MTHGLLVADIFQLAGARRRHVADALAGIDAGEEIISSKCRKPRQFAERAPLIWPTWHSAGWPRAIFHLEYQLFARRESGRPSG